MKKFVVDTSVVLKWYLSDEHGVRQALSLLEEFFEGKIALHAPDLIDYEFVNAMWVAGKIGRISVEDRDTAVKNFLDIEIIKTDIENLFETILTFSTEHNRSCYDASYLALSAIIGAPFVTSDKKLYNAVKSKISSIVWIEDVAGH